MLVLILRKDLPTYNYNGEKIIMSLQKQFLYKTLKNRYLYTKIV